jgi:hypothetical protein
MACEGEADYKIQFTGKYNIQLLCLTSYNESTEWAMKYENIHTTRVGIA